MTHGSTTDAKSRLLELLAERSWTRGTVTLASGQVSDFYIDCKQTALHAEGAALIGELFFDRVSQLVTPVVAVGGLTLGADPLAVATAVASHARGAPVDAFIIRKEPKEHGTGAWLEGANRLSAGAPVAILEDVVTTGGSTLKAIARARESGLDPKIVLCLVDREAGGVEAIREQGGLDVISLFSRSDFDAL